tara:strand:+ start:9228 stop:10412 length:1185 start_codon:yes stop_codon:yes gene_type:complete
MRVTTGNVTYGKKEKDAVNDVLDSTWLSPGKKVREFEEGMATLFGKEFGVMVNSGSSANFLVLNMLKRPKVEVITPALTFGTTAAPIIQNGMIPKFFDVDLETYQIDVDAVEEYLEKTPGQGRIFMIPALIGNLPDLGRLRSLSNKYDIPFVLDSCDTCGAFWDGHPVGMYADLATSSFYSSHIITAAGAGGIIVTDNEEESLKLRSLRGWGRASAYTNESEDVSDRFDFSVDDMPYDTKLAFVDLGFNMQATEIMGAFGVEQLRKLSGFAAKRDGVFLKLVHHFGNMQYFLMPRQHPKTDTRWINFPITLAPKCPFSRRELVVYLEENNIQTRPLFSGNITRHPAFRTGGPTSFKNADYTMRNSFLIGCHHGLEQEHLDYLFEKFDVFLRKHA